MSRFNSSNVIAAVVPLVCVLGGALALYLQYRRIADIRADRERTEQNIALVQRQLTSIEGEPPPARIPTMEMTPKEQVDFLYSLRAYADATHVRLVSWTNGTPLAPTASSGRDDATASHLPAGVTAISSAVVVSGTYANLREFLYYLLRSPRLQSMSDMRWARGETWPASSVSFTLTRYVTPPAAGGGVVQAPAVGVGSPMRLPARPLGNTTLGTAALPPALPTRTP